MLRALKLYNIITNRLTILCINDLKILIKSILIPSGAEHIIELHFDFENSHEMLFFS